MDESKKDITVPVVKKDADTSKKIIGEFKIKVLEEESKVKAKNESNLFTNGKMKRSSENVKSDRQLQPKGLSKIKSAENLFTPLIQ